MFAPLGTQDWKPNIANSVKWFVISIKPSPWIRHESIPELKWEKFHSACSLIYLVKKQAGWFFSKPASLFRSARLETSEYIHLLFQFLFLLLFPFFLWTFIFPFLFGLDFAIKKGFVSLLLLDLKMKFNLTRIRSKNWIRYDILKTWKTAQNICKYY